jgi:hypothetical protein
VVVEVAAAAIVVSSVRLVIAADSPCAALPPAIGLSTLVVNVPVVPLTAAVDATDAALNAPENVPVVPATPAENVPVVPLTAAVDATDAGVNAPVDTAPLNVPVVPLIAPEETTEVGLNAAVDTAPENVPVVADIAPLNVPVVPEIAPEDATEAGLIAAVDTAPENVPVVADIAPLDVSDDTVNAVGSVTADGSGADTGDRLIVVTAVPLVYAEIRARTVAYPPAGICQIPELVVELTGVPPAAGNPTTAV